MSDDRIFISDPAKFSPHKDAPPKATEPSTFFAASQVIPNRNTNIIIGQTIFFMFDAEFPGKKSFHFLGGRGHDMSDQEIIDHCDYAYRTDFVGHQWARKLSFDIPLLNVATKLVFYCAADDEYFDHKYEDRQGNVVGALVIKNHDQHGQLWDYTTISDKKGKDKILYFTHLNTTPFNFEYGLNLIDGPISGLQIDPSIRNGGG